MSNVCRVPVDVLLGRSHTELLGLFTSPPESHFLRPKLNGGGFPPSSLLPKCALLRVSSSMGWARLGAFGELVLEAPLERQVALARAQPRAHLTQSPALLPYSTKHRIS